MDIHNWFGLTYSNYLVLNRTILQSMPVEWQERFTSMLDEVREAVDRAGLDVPSQYRVTPVDAHGKFKRDPIPHYRRAPNVLRKDKAAP